MSEARPDWTWDEELDAGAADCGDLLLLLKSRFDPLAPLRRVLLRTPSAGARVEVPAWCRLTGHRLIEASPPYFLIERRDDRNRR